MKVFRSPRQLQKYLLREKQRGRRISVVPTMGALHRGHLALVKRARRLGDILVVTIFVNPTQFAPGEDFERYPRNIKVDKELLENEGVDILFLPNRRSIYPEGFDTYVLPGWISDRLEGKARPGHFQGVATIVLKLFNIVQPEIAVFGRKDLQQSLVIERMAEDLDLPVKIVVAPTVRDSDGLALSSRNAYLGELGRRRALIISDSLFAAREKIRAGERSAARIISYIGRRLEREAGARVDYVSLADRHTLAELKKIAGEIAISLACRIDGVRLIDNITMKVE
jgi:pantoate--beta-alanine ligase